MLLRFFRSTGAQVIIVIFLLGLLFWLPSFIQVPKTVFFFDKAPMPLYKFITDYLPSRSVFGTLLTFFLVVLEGFLLVRLNTQFILINNRTYFPALFFILLTASVPDLQRLSPMIFAGFFLLLALVKLFESYRTNEVSNDFFKASFYLSIGTLFYPFLVLFVPIVWISLIILKPFNWREWIFTIMGFLAPLFLTFSFYYLIYNQPYRLWDDYLSILNFTYHTPDYYSIPVIVFLGLIALLVIISSQFMMRNFGGKKILPRKAFIIFLWLSINIIVVYLLVTKASIELMFLMAIPVSYLLAHYFALAKSVFWVNVFLLVMFLTLLIIHLWDIFQIHV